MHKANSKDLIEEFFQLCHNSQKWRNWVDDKFNPVLNKEETIMIAGHYVFSDHFFKCIKGQFANIDAAIKNEIKGKINCLLKLSKDE